MPVSEFTKQASQKFGEKKKPSQFTEVVASSIKLSEKKEKEQTLLQKFGGSGTTTGFDTGIKSTTPAVLEKPEPVSQFTKEVAQSFARTTSAAIKGGVFAPLGLSGTTRNPVDVEVDPQSRIAQVLTGRKEPFTLRQEGEETLKGFGAGEKTALNFGGVVGGLIPILDFIPIGRGAKTISGASKMVARSSTPDEAFRGIKELGFSDDVARREAETLFQKTDTSEIGERLTQLVKEQNTEAALRVGQATARTTDEAQVQKTLQDAGIKKSEAKKLAPEVAKETDPTAIARKVAGESFDEDVATRFRGTDTPPQAPTSPVAKSLAPDVTNPTSFKTADDYIKAQENSIFYHGDAYAGYSDTPNFEVRSGLSLTSDISFAESYAARSSERGIIEDGAKVRNFQLNSKAKVLDRTNLGRIDGEEMTRVINEAKEKGYDAVKFETTNVGGIGGSDELHILNPKVVKEVPNEALKTRSQLIEDYNKATKSALPKSTKPLTAEEAVKAGMTQDEWLKAQGTPEKILPIIDDAKKYRNVNDWLDDNPYLYTNKAPDGANVAPVNFKTKDLQDWKDMAKGADSVRETIVPINKLEPKIAGGKKGLTPAEQIAEQGWSDTGTGDFPAPVIELQGDGTLKILDGNHRITFFSENGYDYVPVRLIDKKGIISEIDKMIEGGKIEYIDDLFETVKTRSQLIEDFNRAKGGADEAIPGAPRAGQRSGTRVVTPEGRKLVENPRVEESIKEQGYDSIREIEDIVNAPIRTGDETPEIARVASEMGYDTNLPKINGVQVGELAGQRFFGSGTRIREIEKEIAQIRGQRLAGSIDPKEANKLVEKLNKEKKAIAEKVGVAIHSETGKPIIRKSGLYAEAEWMEQPLESVSGKALSFNLRDWGFTIDGITAEQAAQRGGFGMGAHLQIGVRQADVAKGTFSEMQGQRIQNALQENGVKLNTKSGRQLNASLWGIDEALIAEGKAGQAVDDMLRKMEVDESLITSRMPFGARALLIRAVKDGIPDGVRRSKDAIRAELDQLRETANVVRKEMGKPELGFVDDYAPLLRNQSFWHQIQADARTTITDNFDFIVPNAKRNPHAIPREGGMKSIETNAFTTLSQYIDNVANDIFVAPQIEKLKAVRDAMKGRVDADDLSGNIQFIDNVIRQNLVGQPGFISSIIGLTRGRKVTTLVEKTIQARSVSALAANVVWMAIVQPASALGLTLPRLGGAGLTGIPHGIADFGTGLFDFVTNKGIRQRMGKRPTLAAKTRGASVGMTGAGDINKLHATIQKGKIESFNDFVGKLADANEYWLTTSAMAGGYRKATRLGLKGRDADIYADWMGGATQSDYTKLGRPLILNDTAVRFIAPFQTFAFEMFRFVRTLAGRKGGIPLEKSARINQAIMLVAGAWLYNQYTEATVGRTLTTPGAAIPIVGGYAENQARKLAASFGWMEKGQAGLGRNPVAPAEDVESFIKAIGTFRESGHIDPLRKELTKWIMGYTGIAGASTVNRFVDGMIANVRGGQLTSGGNLAFPLSGSDRFIAPVLGPWSTSAGKAYLNRIEDSKVEEARMRSVWEQAQELVKQGRDNEAQAIVEALSGKDWETYKKIRTKERVRRSEEMKVEVLPIFQKAQRLAEEGKEEEAQEIVDNLSEEEWEAYEKLRDMKRKREKAENGEQPEMFDGEIHEEGEIVDLVLVYAQAIVTDPLTAFQTMFNEEKLRKVEGGLSGTVIVHRVPLEESQRVRAERAGELREQGEEVDLNEMRLDHRVPLQLGGDNSEDNLDLIPIGIWEAYTPVENHLGRLLRNKEISKKEAQQLILDFKEGRIDAQEILDR